MCLMAICMFSLEKHSSRSSTHFLIGQYSFFFLILSCMSCLYILNINPVSVALFADIFLPVCRLSFYFVSFAFIIVVVQSPSHVRLCNPMDYSIPGFPFLTFFQSLPFAVQQLLSLIKSSLFNFAFISFAFGDRCKKILL